MNLSLYCTIYLIFAIYKYINLSILYHILKKLEKSQKKNLLDFMFKISAKKPFNLKESQEI